MSRVWVTGARGFIGRHLARRLADSGKTVMGLGHGAWPDGNAREHGVAFWLNGDVNGANLHQLFQRGGKPDAIFHLAGGSSVGFSTQFPLEDFQRTVTSTAEVLEWTRNFAPQSRLVTVSSAAVYGNSTASLLAEEGNYTPYSPYGFHIRMAEQLCSSYAAHFRLGICVVRLFSIFGPGLQKQLLWDLCSKLKDNPETLSMQGTGDEVRDWLHVEEATRVLERVGSLQTSGFQVINGGTGQGTRVGDIVNMVCKAWGSSASVSFSGMTRAGDPQRLVADTSQLQAVAGPLQQRDLQADIADYVRWFKGGLK